jgi:gluconolactonase
MPSQVSLLQYDRRLTHLVDAHQEVSLVVHELGSAEGPSWNPATQSLLFCSVLAEKLCRWNARDGFSILRSDTNVASGTSYDAAGRIVCCEQTTHRIVRMRDDGGGYEVMAAYFADRELNGPNDVVVRSDGGIYFSDPNFSRRATLISAMSHAPQPVQGIYRLDSATKEIRLATGETQNPNGLCFSTDEKKAFVAETALSRILSFDVAGDGSFKNKKVFAVTHGEGRGVPDGIKADVDDNIYCTAQGGVHVFSPAGTCLGVIRAPGPPDNICFNLCFGGSDFRQLFLCCLDGVYSVRSRLPGALSRRSW